MSFSVGTSSAPMDMALDDIIKRRTSTRKKTPSKAAEATGKGKAQRQAAANARRGISKAAKPSKMDVDKQVNRQQKNHQKGGNNNNNDNNNRGGRGNNAGRRATAPSAASVRAKAANKGKGNANANNANTNNNQGVIQAPSQQAISAAARAMKDNGFKPPKGMQMQITFVPKKTPNNNSNSNQGGGKKQQGNNNNNNNNNQGKQGRGRGRGPRR